MHNAIDSDDDDADKKGYREDGHFDREHFLSVYVNSLNGGLQPYEYCPAVGRQKCIYKDKDKDRYKQKDKYR